LFLEKIYFFQVDLVGKSSFWYRKPSLRLNVIINGSVFIEEEKTFVAGSNFESAEGRKVLHFNRWPCAPDSLFDIVV